MNNTYIDSWRISRKTTQFERLITSLTIILIILAIMLPTGSIYNFKIKYLITILVAISLGIHLILHRKINRAVFSLIVLFGVISLFICWGWLIASFNGIMLSSVLSESIVILSTLAIVLLPSYLVAVRIISPMELLNTILKITFAYALVKIFFALLILLHIVSGNELFGLITRVFGYSGMTNDYSDQMNAFLRINFPSDYVLPVALFISFLFFLRGKQTIYKGLFAIVVYIIALILTYSRFLWLFGLVSIFLVYVVYNRNNFSVGIKKLNYLLPLFVLLMIILLLLLQPKYGNSLNNYIYQRYTGDFAQFSDSSRTIMSYELIKMALNKPIFGWGLGAYVLDYVRFPESPWLYELQWLSFFMQYGFLGIGILIGLCAWYLRSIFLSRSTIIVGSAILFFVFLSVGFFNCFLLYSPIGVIYFLFYLIPKINWNYL